MSDYIKVEFPNNPQPFKKAYQVMFRQEMYAHDYGVIYFRDWNISPLTIRPGTLMKLTIKGKEFFGYIHDIKNEQSNNKNFTKVGFIGASFVMKQASQKIYTNVSADQIIAEIAERYNFAYKATPHPRIYPQVSQAGMTDWEFMVYLARQSGYFLRAENTEIYFQPITEDFKQLIEEATSFQKSDGGFKPKNPIYNFNPIISETLRKGMFSKSASSIAGVNPVDGSYFKVAREDRPEFSRVYSNPEFFDKHSTYTVANDFTTATHLAETSDEHSRFPYTAKVETIGVSSLRPGLPVHFGNVGAEYSGYWTILSVEHHIKEDELNHPLYTCILNAGSDSLGATANSNISITPPVRPKRKVSPNKKNRNIKPRTIINLPNTSVKPIKNIQLVDRINRPNIGGPAVSTARWGSTHRDLTYTIIDEKMPQAVLDKVRFNGSLR